MLIDEQNKIEKESIKKIKRNYSRTNLSLKQHLNKNKDIYSSFFENENSTYKMNKEKRNLSQPKERHKILNMKEEQLKKLKKPSCNMSVILRADY